MKILSSCSARPNFVKLAAVHHALSEISDIEHVIVHTGQHYDPLFSDVFFEQLAIPLPNENLGIHGGSREDVIGHTEAAFNEVLPNHQPDIVLVYGDVNGAVGAARAAKKQNMKLAHVEAGLRSFDTDMPEELNRIEIDQLADILLCSEQSGMDHLETEGVAGARHLVGNTMIDTLIRMMPAIEGESLPEGIPSSYAVVTMHRPSNVDTKEALQANIQFLNEVAQQCPLVLPVHHRFQAGLDEFGLHDEVADQIHLIPPLGYIPFLRLVQGAQFIMTDSGGLQEEATFLQKKCFTLRRNTERPSTIESGSNTLVDPADADDRQNVIDFAERGELPKITVPALWDGKTGERIVEVLVA